MPAGETVKRDKLALNFPEMVNRALDESRRLSLPINLEMTQFKKLIEATSKKRSTQSRAPGVLEHRLTPRLEWLVDFGYLSKVGLPKNGFEYRVMPAAKGFLIDLDRFVGTDHWAENVAISQANTNPSLQDLRENVCRDRQQSLLKAYGMVRKRVGPSSLADVAFATALLSKDAEEFTDTLDFIISFAQKTKGVELSGGRYKRSLENIFIPEELFKLGSSH